MPSTPRKIVVLGASSNPERYSNMLMRRLRGRAGFEVIPVNPAQGEIEGLPVAATLDAVERAPDILTLYVGPDRSAALADAIVSLKPGKVIFNPGAENPALASRLRAEGIESENACSLVLLGQNQL